MPYIEVTGARGKRHFVYATLLICGAFDRTRMVKWELTLNIFKPLQLLDLVVINTQTGDNLT